MPPSKVAVPEKMITFTAGKDFQPATRGDISHIDIYMHSYLYIFRSIGLTLLIDTSCLLMLVLLHFMHILVCENTRIFALIVACYAAFAYYSLSFF